MRKILVVILCAGLAGGASADDTVLTGFVDGSYLYDANAGAGEFGIDQAEIDVMYSASAKTAVRADVEWVKSGNTFVAQLEQAFVSYTRDCGTTFTFGQFNAPIGFEMLDAPDMYQFSHALVFDYGLPTNVTGLMAGRALGEHFDIVAYICNGWDRNTEDNENPTYGGRLGYVADGGPGVGLSVLSGKEDMGPAAFTRTVFDVDLTWQTGLWTFGGEFNKGDVSLADGSELAWTGFLVMAHVDVNEWFGFTGRYDTFDDEDGFAFGMAQKRSSLTFAPTFVLDDGFGTLFELRLDSSDEEVWTDSDGDPTDSALTIAWEATYSW